MIDLKALNRLIEQIAEEKGLEKEKVLGAIEDAIAAAYKKEYGERGAWVKCVLSLKTGEMEFYRSKTVVDETTVRIAEEGEEEKEDKKDGEDVLPRYNPERHIFLKEAKETKKDAQLGEEILFPLEEHQDFGRIAAQVAKQVILQKFREAEKSSIIEEFKKKEGEIVSGIIQRIEHGNIYINLGRTTGVMFFNETIPGEYYKIGDRKRFYLLAVQEETKRMPGLVLSRMHPHFINKLFEMEVPEIHDGVVEIKGVSREAGSRTKIAVASTVDGVDPVGSCIGQKGIRVMTITDELGQEKIDVIPWSDDAAKFVGSSLSPAKVRSVEILPRREALVYVPDDQLSLAIGKGGQNVRLAAKLTGWKIDVRSQSNPEEVLECGVAGVVEEKEEPVIESEEVKEVKPEGTEKPVKKPRAVPSGRQAKKTKKEEKTEE
ncbi:MAG: transcription termination factor NusA [Candidatus Paceibacterota bacterium]|jgi:N utilization substance protein A